MDVWEVRKRESHPQPDMPCLTPENKIDIFLSCHQCTDTNICNKDCIAELEQYLEYNEEEIQKIEQATRGQSDNCNWHYVRRGIITASKIKQVCRSTNVTKTSLALLAGSHINPDLTPQHIAFGNKYEEVARNQFLKSHKFHHRSCSISQTGIFLSSRYSFLGASPDGILTCEKCPHTSSLIEIKCLSSKRNFHPTSALLLLGICTKKDDGTIELIKQHSYYYQMQGQMLVTNLKMCLFVGFTHKGITVVEVPFDEEFCNAMWSSLKTFYTEAFFPVIRAVGHV